MDDFEELYALELEEKTEEEEKLTKEIIEFIGKRESEDGEYPDEDTIVESLEISKDMEHIVGKTYRMYWESLLVSRIKNIWVNEK